MLCYRVTKNEGGYFLVEIIVSFCILAFCMIFFLDMNSWIVKNSDQIKDESLFIVKARNKSLQLLNSIENLGIYNDSDSFETDAKINIRVSYDPVNVVMPGMTLVRIEISNDRFCHTSQRLMNLSVLGGSIEDGNYAFK